MAERIYYWNKISRYTSWSIDQEIASDYGNKRERRLIWAIIKPDDIVCDISAFEPRVNWLNQQEMIVKPGVYKRNISENRNPIQSKDDIEQAAWWLTRWISGSIDDPDWDERLKFCIRLSATHTHSRNQ